MKLYKKQAFSLTELLIVLVVVAVLFAALAPIVTHRRNGMTSGQETVWQFVNNDDDKDAYYDGGMIKQTSTAYVGVKPTSLSNKAPYAKVVLKANKADNKPQNMIQFRYGSGNGTLTGIFFADDKGNYINTSRLGGTVEKNYNDLFVNSNAKNNTIIGNDAFSMVKNQATDNVGIGSSVMSEANNPYSNVVVGSGSGKYISGNNTILGAGSGLGKGSISNNVLVGANIMSLDESTGSNNVVAGTNVAVAGLRNHFLGNSTGNTIIGANQLKASYLKDSTIIGQSAFVGKNDDMIRPEGLTAIGYNACSSMKSTAIFGKGAKTCIGTTSGQATNNTFDSFAEDDYDHIFIGGVPTTAWPGRSVLEVHNIKDAKQSLTDVKPNLSPTVVMNSHLVVRGNIVIPTSQGVLAPAMYTPTARGDKSIQDHDFCSRCMFGRRSWKRKFGCNDVVDKVIDILEILTFFPRAYIAAALAPVIIVESLAGGKWVGDFVNHSIDGTFEAKDLGKTKILQEAVSNSSISLKVACQAGVCPQLKVSDIRLKDNITENTDALAKIMNVTPYSYTYKADQNALPQVGVIAQDLQAYMPNSVSKDKDGFLQIRWDELFFTALNSIKALDSKLNNLALTIRSLEENTVEIAQDQKSVKKRINDIDKRLNKLEK